MSVSITFNGTAEDIRAEMATLLGGPLMPAFATTLLADAKARQEGKNLDDSVRRETTAVEEAATTEATPAKGRGRPKKATPVVEAATEVSAEQLATVIAIGSSPAVGAAPEADEPETVAETFAGALKAPTPEPTAKEKADAEFAKLFAEKSAEFAAAKSAGTLTVDNVRAAATPYVNKHGIANASSDLVSCLKDATSGTCEKMSDCKDQATMIAAGEALLAAAAADKRYGQ